ncbi:MAG TPA: hypothetical protein VEC75_14335, partial [Stellaceae bacterium]|nr:hypothetical protein [Stellaceae bacterium]
KPDPGPQRFTWGTLTGRWELQYGDSIADVRFARVFNEKESEATSQLALPESVVIEVETGAEIADETIPIRFGQGSADGPGREMTASRIAGHPRLYRTPPLVFAAEGAVTPPAGGAEIVRLRKGARVYATIDRAKTHFLRAGLATAVASEPSSLWLVSLQKAWTCAPDWERGGLPPLEMGNDWQAFAKEPAEDVKLRGASLFGSIAKDTISITYGDHAAMLLLRDTFAQTITGQLAELARVETDDGLVDAWYRTLQGVINAAPNSPLAQFKVSSPAVGGDVAFREAYSVDFEERTFQARDSVTGQQRYRDWRREATRKALVFLREQMQQSLASVQAIGDCDRLELLKLTGHGFKGVAQRVAPLLMKHPGLVIKGYAFDNELAEPDRLARGYTANLDQLAEAVANAEQFTSLADSAIITVVLVLVPPAAEIGWAAAGLAGGQAVGVLSGVVSGLAMFGYESANQIYQTYQQHEDVRFAFSTASVLGLERYFDAESRSTPWWQTGVSIFGQAVLQGIGIAGAIKPLREGVKIWRGAAVLAKTEKITLPVLRALPVEEQQNVAAILLREEEAVADVAIVDARAQQATADFDRFAAETAANPPPEPQEPAVVRELEAQAANPIDDMKTVDAPPPDPLRAQKQEIANNELGEALDEQGEVSEANVPAEADATINVSPEELEVGVKRPIPTTGSMPLPDHPWVTEVTVGGKKVTVTFDVGGLISDKSAFFNVYELKSIPPELAADIPEEVGKDLVIKVLKRDSENLKKIMNEPDWQGVLDHVVDRMMKADGRLRDASIP